jgi:clan AA aspartic protease, TIGR02281 family
MRGRLLLLIGILVVGAIVLIATHDTGSVAGLDSEDFARLVSLGALALAIGSGALLARRNAGGAIRALGAWAIIILALVTGYQYRYELQDVASRLTAGLVPGSPLTVTDSSGRITVMLEKRAYGHFETKGAVNGTPVDFLVDTGATTTVLTAQDAARAGYDVSALPFSLPVATANGVTQAASIRDVDISVGGIERKGLTVLVAKPGSLGQSLLGMNFIATLSGFDMRGDRLILRE